MSRPSHREVILTKGSRILHERGFTGASVRDIVKAAGVPQGSFTNHFSSKESFGLEVLNIYHAGGAQLTQQTLKNDSLPPLKRLRKWVDGTLGKLNQNDEWNGCLLGNIGAENAEGNSLIHKRVGEIFLEIQSDIAYCLKAAVVAGELSPDTNCNELAGVIHASLEGSVLKAKALRSSTPTTAFKRILFSQILRPIAE
jgi:TetR/AcrR family transcriptional regulator, transcriptional repressor for nem operon